MSIGTGTAGIGRLGSGFSGRYRDWVNRKRRAASPGSSMTSGETSPAIPRRTAATGFAGKWESYGNRVVQTQPSRPGMPATGSGPQGYASSAAGRDPVAALAARRRSIDAAGKRYWGDSGPPPSTSGGRSRFAQFNPTGRPYGSDNPKLLSYRRFTSKWLSPSTPGEPRTGLLQPNTTVGRKYNLSGGFRPRDVYMASQRHKLASSQKRFGGTYAERAGQIGIRATV